MNESIDLDNLNPPNSIGWQIVCGVFWGAGLGATAGFWWWVLG